jgi:HisJ family histidinol phosphate phosphatase
MLFLWFYHACRRGMPRYMMVTDHINYLTFEDPGAVNTLRRALKLAQARDLYGAAEVAGVDVAHAAVVSEGLRRGMRFSIGAELDNDPRSRPDAQNIVEAMRPDGMIRSVHFLSIDHPEKGADFAWPFDNPEFESLFDHVGVERTWELYVDRLIDDITKLPGNIVGHFYVPATFGHWPSKEKLGAYEDRLLEACAARGMAVEINTRFLYRDHPDDQRKKYIDANMRLMRKAKAKHVGIAIGSDAHSPKDQANAFDVVLKMLDDTGINELVFPVNGRLARVALRATREHIERHAKKREPAQPGSSISGFGRAELGLPEQPEIVGSGRAQRDVGPKKRTTGPQRTTKTTAKESRASKGASKEKPAAKVKPVKDKPVKQKPAPKKAPPKPAKPAKPVKAAKRVAAKPAKPAAKKPPRAPAKPPLKTKPSGKAPAKKAPPKKPATHVKKAVAPSKKGVAKKVAAPAKKAAPKKVAPKKATPPPKQRAASKKPATLKKKPAAAAKHVPAKKPAAKKAAGKPTAKKKPPTKRR